MPKRPGSAGSSPTPWTRANVQNTANQCQKVGLSQLLSANFAPFLKASQSQQTKLTLGATERGYKHLAVVQPQQTLRIAPPKPTLPVLRSVLKGRDFKLGGCGGFPLEQLDPA